MAELNAIAWLHPFNNSADKGRWDPGWSCRDHSVVLAALLAVAGVKAHVVRGANMFVQGPTSRGDGSIGLGNDLNQGGDHTWLTVDGFGAIDVSPRLDARFDSWRPLPVSGVVGTEWSIPGLVSNVAFVDDAAEYERTVAVARNAGDTATAVYWPRHVEDFHAGMLKLGAVDSPLSHRLSDVAGDDCYIKLAAHLLGLSQGVRKSLARVSQRKAWRFLNEVPAQLIGELTAGINSLG